MKCFAKYKQTWKTCIVCGNTFPDPQCNLTKCCSKECSSIHRKQLVESGAYDKNIEKMFENKAIFDETHQGEDHIGAKQWEIESPSGERYQCINLMHFIRNNLHLFDGTAKQIYDGFQKIKASEQGKRKYKSYTYKGWKLIGWGNDWPNKIRKNKHMKRWKEKYKLLQQYVEINKCLPNLNTKIANGVRIGTWVYQQKINKEKLTKEQIVKLESLGVKLEVNKNRRTFEKNIEWEEWYKLAEEYFEKYGNLKICKEQGTDNLIGLGLWLRNNRFAHKKGELEQDKVDKLNQLNMIWQEKVILGWEKWYEIAKKYYEENGNLMVPYVYKTINGEKLGIWITQQRQKYNGTARNRLPKEKIEELEKIGMIWEVYQKERNTSQ